MTQASAGRLSLVRAKTGRGYWWCARPKGAQAATITVDTLDELDAAIEGRGLSAGLPSRQVVCPTWQTGTLRQ